MRERDRPYSRLSNSNVNTCQHTVREGGIPQRRMTANNVNTWQYCGREGDMQQCRMISGYPALPEEKVDQITHMYVTPRDPNPLDECRTNLNSLCFMFIRVDKQGFTKTK